MNKQPTSKDLKKLACDALQVHLGFHPSTSSIILLEFGIGDDNVCDYLSFCVEGHSCWEYQIHRTLTKGWDLVQGYPYILLIDDTFKS